MYIYFRSKSRSQFQSNRTEGGKHQCRRRTMCSLMLVSILGCAEPHRTSLPHRREQRASIMLSRYTPHAVGASRSSRVSKSTAAECVHGPPASRAATTSGAIATHYSVRVPSHTWANIEIYCAFAYCTARILGRPREASNHALFARRRANSTSFQKHQTPDEPHLGQH